MQERQDVKFRCRSTPDEPIWEFRAQDRLAPSVLEYWAEQLERAVSNSVGDKADSARKKVKLARSVAHRMRAWQELNYTKTPD